jgi:hypothetical protein
LAYRYEEEGYLILVRDKVELHFFRAPIVEPKKSGHGAFLRVEDANDFSNEAAEMGWPQQGIPSVGLAENKTWGMCELGILDPDGNLLRVGHRLNESSP